MELIWRCMYNIPVLFLGDNALEINKSAVEAERGLCQLNAHKNVFMYHSADLLVLVTFSSQCLLSQVLFLTNIHSYKKCIWRSVPKLI